MPLNLPTGAVWLLSMAGASLLSSAGLWWLHEMGPASPAGLRGQLLLWLVAGVLWAVGVRALWQSAQHPQPPRRLPRGTAVCVVALLAMPRLAACFLPAVHTQDLHRYVFDGAVQRAGHNPFLAPPDAVQYESVAREQPEAFARITHRYLPTIYPPTAQLALRLSAALGRTGESAHTAQARWRWLVGICELLSLCALLWGSRQRSHDVRPALSIGLCPLWSTEQWLDGHLDGIGVLWWLLCLCLLPALRGVQTPRSTLATLGAGAALALSCLVKPLASVLALDLLSHRPSRRWTILFALGGAAAAVCVWWPFRQAGLSVMPSLGEYGRRWRSNDGLFALLQGAAEGLVALLYRPPHYTPWSFESLARLITGRDRATVWPDELSGFVARALAGGGLLACGAIALRRALPLGILSLVLLTAYALLTPTLHVWYLLWPLALVPCAFGTRWIWPVVWLAISAPLSYLPLIEELAHLPHREPIWSRALQHAPACLLFAWAFVKQPRTPTETDSPPA